MISDEGQQRAANTQRESAEMNLRAAESFQQSVWQLQQLLGEGYGNQVSQLIEALNKFQKEETK